MARPEGFEPPASASGGQRSIQLSYGRMIVKLTVSLTPFSPPDCWLRRAALYPAELRAQKLVSSSKGRGSGKAPRAFGQRSRGFAASPARSTGSRAFGRKKVHRTFFCFALTQLSYGRKTCLTDLARFGVALGARKPGGEGR